jgi:hypothetical protein
MTLDFDAHDDGPDYAEMMEELYREAGLDLHAPPINDDLSWPRGRAEVAAFVEALQALLRGDLPGGFTFLVDTRAPRGDVIPALARLLRGLAASRRAEYNKAARADVGASALA